VQQKAEPFFFSFMPRYHGSQRSQLKALISPCDFDFDFVSLTIAYRRLSALGRDKLVGSHAVASSRDQALVACEPCSPPTSHKHIHSDPAFFLPLYTSLLPDDNTRYHHTYYQTTSQTSTSILAHSKRGIFTDVLYTQSPKQTAKGIYESLQNNNRPDSQPPLYTSTKL
jgi:hypothetical protein